VSNAVPNKIAIQSICMMIYSKILGERMTMPEALVLIKKVADTGEIDFTQENQATFDRVIKGEPLPSCQTGVSSTRSVGGLK